MFAVFYDFSGRFITNGRKNVKNKMKSNSFFLSCVCKRVGVTQRPAETENERRRRKKNGNTQNEEEKATIECIQFSRLAFPFACYRLPNVSRLVFVEKEKRRRRKTTSSKKIMMMSSLPDRQIDNRRQRDRNEKSTEHRCFFHLLRHFFHSNRTTKNKKRPNFFSYDFYW